MKTILIIEDDRRVAAALEIRLKAAGYEVLKALDGLEGLKLAAHYRPDLVIMDVWMPGGVGFLIAQRLKHIGLAQTPVIFLTASKKKDLWAIAEELSPAGFFEKPYDSKQLLDSIGLALGRSHLACLVKAPPRRTVPKDYEKSTHHRR
jgi:DNA-binding response OmpR family regulator